jgi:hypothetical protein
MSTTANLPIVRVPDVAEIVQLREGHPMMKWHTDSWNNKPSTYRVTAWLKSWKPPAPKMSEPNDHRAIFAAMLRNGLSSTVREFEVDGKMTRLVFCTREDAEFVEVVGACGLMFAIHEIEVVGKVSWSEDQIDQHRRQALMFVGEVVY